MATREPNSIRYWLGIFFGSFDMPVTTEELDEFWNSLTEDERYAYYWQMESSWPWWNDQGAFGVRKRFKIND